MVVAGRVVALVPAAGSGSRLGHAEPKAFVELDGKSLLLRSVAGLRSSGVIDRVVAVVPADCMQRARSVLPSDVQIIVGGAERLDSVRRGIDASPDADILVVHDAARALTPPSLIARVVEFVRTEGVGVVPALPVVDTIKSVDELGAIENTLDRSALRAIQTPQAFVADVLRRAYRHPEAHTATDDASLVERLGEPVRTVPGDPRAFKITTPIDLILARALIAQDATGEDETTHLAATRFGGPA